MIAITLIIYQSKQNYIPAPTRIEAHNDREFQNITLFTDDERLVGLFVNGKVFTGLRLGFFVGKLFSMGRGDSDSVAALINQVQIMDEEYEACIAVNSLWRTRYKWDKCSPATVGRREVDVVVVGEVVDGLTHSPNLSVSENPIFPPE